MNLKPKILSYMPVDKLIIWSTYNLYLWYMYHNRQLRPSLRNIVNMAEAILFLGIIAFKMQVVTKVNWNQVGWSKTKLYWVRIELRSDGVAVRADVKARTYLQPHYGNGVFGNVYLPAGQH